MSTDRREMGKAEKGREYPHAWRSIPEEVEEPMSECLNCDMIVFDWDRVNWQECDALKPLKQGKGGLG